MMNRFLFLIAGLMLCLAPLSGCTPAPTVTKIDGLATPTKNEVYILPFRTIMVPEAVSERVLNQFVDQLNMQGEDKGLFFIIYKDVDRDGDDWLADKYYIDGDLYGYNEESGCCSTFINLNGKLDYYQPANSEPALSVSYPAEVIINAEVTNPEEIREKFIAEFSSTMAEQLISALNLK